MRNYAKSFPSKLGRWERSSWRAAQASTNPRWHAKTYLLGERHIWFAAYETGTLGDDNEGWVAGYNNDSIRWSALPPESDSVDPPEHYTSRWGSPHVTVFNVAMCDGSVRGIPFDIDPALHQVLGNRSDSQTLGGKTYDLSGLPD